MKRLTNILLALASIFFPALASSARACSCLPISSPYKAHQQARAVFIGKAVSSSDVPVSEQLGDKTDTAHERHYRFAIEESFKGTKKSEVKVNTGRIDSTCFVGFTVGETYLVYAQGESDSALSSHMCSRTSNLIGASADLHYLRALMKGEPEPRVYGAITRSENDLSKSRSAVIVPMEGIKIIVEGTGGRFEAITDKQGLYSFANVPDGKYKAWPELPDKYMSYFPREEEFVLETGEAGYPVVQQGDSAYARFNIGWNNQISGRILDAEGTPIMRVKAAIMLARQNDSPLVVKEDEYDSHPNGKYNFYGLTPASYLLSVIIRAPFKSSDKPTRFYYPRAVSPGQASEFTIGESDSLTDMDIKLPPEYVVRTVEGMLVWPDGSPVTGGWVFLTDSDRAGADENKKYDWATADGQFYLQAFVGAEYWVHASVGTWKMKSNSGKSLWDSGIQTLYAKPVKVTVGKINQPLRIVIPLPAGTEKPQK